MLCAPLPQLKSQDDLKGALLHCQCIAIQFRHGYNTEQTALTNLIN